MNANDSTGTLHVTDSRTGRSYEIPISDGAVRATDLRQIRVDETDVGLLSYAPAFLNTASCRSAITYIDGDNGILRYRGYPIDELAEGASFLQVAYLLLHGSLPGEAEGRAVLDAVHNGGRFSAYQKAFAAMTAEGRPRRRLAIAAM